MKSRGIRFPGRDSESLAPIFTPPRSIPQEVYPVPPQQMHQEIPIQGLSAEQTKEAFDVARNSLELLSTVLSSSPQQDALQVRLLYSKIHHKCMRFVEHIRASALLLIYIST